ncbi:MAG TPA: rRNA maturation RNase YbeY [Vicinamibacterales bacterium]|nr:rRNA maturation RNase YbeY [Vicinamibacterales bacterium]
MTARRGLTVDVIAPRRAAAGVRGLAAWLRRAAPARARGHVTVALITDQRMRQLNATYRKKDRPTDVLSFPARGPGAVGLGPDLGDLAIAVGVARRQAREYGHDLATEVRILALHGLLHLLGYDHEADQGQMRRLEERLRRRGRLPAGLIARTPRGRTLP